MNKVVHSEKGLQSWQFCSFYIGEQLFGVNIQSVKEVNRDVTFTRVFHAPDSIKGYVNIRGTIYLILDLPHMLGSKVDDSSNNSRIILFKSSVGESFGILVDQIGDVVEADESMLEMKEHGQENEESIKSELVKGTCKLKDKLLTIIAEEKLLDQVELVETTA